MWRIHSFHLTTTLWLGLAIALSTNVACAQKFDLEEYLKKIDANKNGRIEENELSDRMKGYVRKLGLDPAKSNAIGTIMKKTKNYDKDKKESKKKNDTSLKVPAFGTEEQVEREPVMPFGVAADDSGSNSVYGSSAATAKVSDSIRERVESTLKRYDQNKNGRLDKDEIKKARWGSPSPQESDLNKDGSLSKSELIRRYQAREESYRSRRSRDSRSSSTSRTSSSRTTSSRSSSTLKSSSSKSSSSRSASRSSSTSSSSSKKSSADVRAKYVRYAKSLISSYDKDGDGKLNKDEIKKMRRPPTGADSNKDGFVSESELIDSFAGSSSKSSSKKPESRTVSKSSSSSRTESSRSRRSRSSTTTSASFDKLDVNTDKQVQMHEFSKKWDDDTVAEFYEIDKNQDGVISLKEWSSRNSR